jgi:hypothetical protein
LHPTITVGIWTPSGPLLAAIEGVAILASNTNYYTDTTLYQPLPIQPTHLSMNSSKTVSGLFTSSPSALTSLMGRLVICRLQEIYASHDLVVKPMPTLLTSARSEGQVYLLGFGSRPLGDDLNNLLYPLPFTRHGN